MRGTISSSGLITQRQIIGIGTLLAAVLTILLVTGCSSSQGNQQALANQKQQNKELQKKVDDLQKQQQKDQQQQNKELQKKVDDLEKQQQQSLQKQIDDLKAQQGSQQPAQVVVQSAPPTSNGSQDVVSVSPDVSATNDQASAALDDVITYYEAAEAGDYTYTYNHLLSVDQDYYTYDQWLAANQALDSADAVFSINDIFAISMVSYRVDLTVYLPDGSSFDRQTIFTYENGVWKHLLTSDEKHMFNSVL